MSQDGAKRIGICHNDYEQFWWNAEKDPVCPQCSPDDEDYDEQHSFFVAESEAAAVGGGGQGTQETRNTGNLRREVWCWPGQRYQRGGCPEYPPDSPSRWWWHGMSATTYKFPDQRYTWIHRLHIEVPAASLTDPWWSA